MKFKRTPLLHSLLLLRQFIQSGVASSHLRCRSRHVKHPVRTLFDLVAVVAASTGAAAFLGLEDSSAMVARDCTLPLRRREWLLLGVPPRMAPSIFWRFVGETSRGRSVKVVVIMCVCVGVGGVFSLNKCKVLELDKEGTGGPENGAAQKKPPGLQLFYRAEGRGGGGCRASTQRVIA